MRKKITSICLAAAILVMALAQTAFAANAQGSITATNVNVRSQPSVLSSKVMMLDKGDKVTVLGSRGEWYNISFEGKEGWVKDDFMIKLATTSSDEPAQTTVKNSSTLRKGDRGDNVKKLQKALIYLGYLNDSADGVFGANTDAAVRKYQKQNGLAVDGLAGRKTQSAVFAEKEQLESLVAYAKTFLGVPYVYGGTSPSGFDCSGLTSYIYKKFGIAINRTSKNQTKNGTPVSKSELRPGDLVFFGNPVGHVGIYIGGGEYLHAPQTGDVVKISKLKSIACARRIIGEVPDAD